MPDQDLDSFGFVASIIRKIEHSLIIFILKTCMPFFLCGTKNEIGNFTASFCLNECELGLRLKKKSIVFEKSG